MKGPNGCRLLLLLCLYICHVVGGKYDFYQEASTWFDARDRCRQENKQLVHVKDTIQHTRMRHYRSFIFHNFWIGLREEGSGSYKWTDDTVARFTAWGQGQPSSQSECVRYDVGDFTWQTHNCSALLHFMCESNIPDSKESDSLTMATGLLMGFGSMLGLLLMGILLVQMPCCRSNTAKAIGHFGLGKR